MDPLSILATYHIEHRHRDGSAGVMVEDRSHHDPADHDPERVWARERLFRCTGCDESVAIKTGGPDVPPSEH